MKALCWFGKRDVRVQDVNDPTILNPRDSIVRVTSTAICGSDLHLYNGYIPTMREGDILGHEFMGEIVETGPAANGLKVGDRVIVPFCIGCGNCYFCDKQLWSLCDNSNPNGWLAEKIYGHPTAGLFGYSHLTGGYAGGQAEFVRVPFSDVNCFKVPQTLRDDQLLFLTDIFPTGYMAAENCHIEKDDIIAVWGCGPVGQFAIRSAWILGAGRVIAIDRVSERLELAASDGRTETINYEESEVFDTLKLMTGSAGPDACIDAVGLEAHGSSLDAIYDQAKQAVRLESDRPHALRQAIHACRKGGTVSVPGVYGGFIDKLPIGAAFQKGLTLRMGQTHVHRYVRPLLDLIERSEIDPSFVISHEIPLEDAAFGYELFVSKEEGCTKVVLKP